MDIEQEIQALKQVNELLLRSMIQPGTVLPFTGANAPGDEWLLCDGSAIRRVEFATLFKVIGETYGSGDGSMTFNLPDLRGRVSIGSGQSTTGLTERTLGQTIGEENHILSVDEIPSHSHFNKTEFGGEHAHSGVTKLAGEHSHSARTGNGGKHSHSASVAANGGHSHSASASGTATVSGFSNSLFGGGGFASVHLAEVVDQEPHPLELSLNLLPIFTMSQLQELVTILILLQLLNLQIISTELKLRSIISTELKLRPTISI